MALSSASQEGEASPVTQRQTEEGRVGRILAGLFQELVEMDGDEKKIDEEREAEKHEFGDHVHSLGNISSRYRCLS